MTYRPGLNSQLLQISRTATKSAATPKPETVSHHLNPFKQKLTLNIRESAAPHFPTQYHDNLTPSIPDHHNEQATETNPYSAYIERYYTTIGVPYGSLTSPLLFNLYIYDLVHIMN